MLFRDKICAVVAATSAAGALAQLDRALRLTRTVELRLDWLESDGEIDRFLNALAERYADGGARTGGRRGAAVRVPTLIATCRRVEAGGKFRGSAAEQLLHLAVALRSGCTWYDLDVETAAVAPRELLDVLIGEGRRLVSAHYFKKAPANLVRVARSLAAYRGDGAKVAVQCDTIRASVKVWDLARRRSDVVAVPMGEAGLPARVLAIAHGSALEYAPVEQGTAPGQVSLDALVNLYRAREITKRTRVYGVIGDPIGHSLSPRLHNAGFRAARVDAVFLPFLVRDLKDFLGAVRALGVRGFAITLPHKQTILRFLDSCDPVAAAIGAVNTVTVSASGKLHGLNTDYVGVLRALERKVELRGSRVLIVGAGGASRAVAYALAQAGASVCITARRPAQAVALARACGGTAVPRSDLRREFFDAIVNATPVGMHPHGDASPLAANELNTRLVFDTIYRPLVTKLMQLAERRGIETVSGLDMLVAQGVAQWEIWTGRRAPVAPMIREVRTALGESSANRVTKRK